MTAPEFTMTAPAAALDRLRPALDRHRSLPRWPLILIALPAAVAVWSGWVGLGTLCGFGIVHPLPGIWDSFKLNTAITLPVGVEAYGAYALAAWLHPGTSATVKRFARNSALGSLGLGMGGQVIYHLLTAWHVHVAPWPVVTLVSCLPVLTLGFGTALTHLLGTARATVSRADDEPWPVGSETAPADDEPDAVAAIEADTNPDSTADTNVVTDADTAPATTAAPTTDSPAATNPAPTRTAPRTRRGPSTATRVARMRGKHPDETPSDIATRLSLSARTVRRYWTGEPEASAA